MIHFSSQPRPSAPPRPPSTIVIAPVHRHRQTLPLAMPSSRTFLHTRRSCVVVPLPPSTSVLAMAPSAASSATVPIEQSVFAHLHDLLERIARDPHPGAQPARRRIPPARRLDRDALYTLESSAGIWLANGYDATDGGVDDCGAPDPSHPAMTTYVSRDAGLHFFPLLNTSTHFDLTSAGLLLAAPTDTQRSTIASFFVSLDDGQSLFSCGLDAVLAPLVADQGGVEDVTVESVRALSVVGPLMVTGSLRVASTGDTRWFVATVEPAVSTCDPAVDYEEVLIPEDQCILGRQLALDRRLPGRLRFEPSNLRARRAISRHVTIA